MAVDYAALGARLKKARIERNITQEEIADKLNVSTVFLSRLENGSSHINLKRLTEICGILGITEGEILNGVAPESQDYLFREFAEILNSVSPQKQRLIYNIAKTIAQTED